jgi:hypothetical protein
MPYTPCPACPPGAPTWGGAVKRRTNVVHAVAAPHVQLSNIFKNQKGVIKDLPKPFPSPTNLKKIFKNFHELFIIRKGYCYVPPQKYYLT